MTERQSVIVDPTNNMVALVDGKVGHGVMLCRIENAAAPTARELESGTLIGYSTQNFGAISGLPDNN